MEEKRLTEIIEKICRCEYSESETDYQLKILEQETGLCNISDYIFWPNLAGMRLDADISEITAKILADKK